MGRPAEAAPPDRHHLPRRAPVPFGDAAADLRHDEDRPDVRVQARRSLFDRDVGRGHLRHIHALPEGRPVGTSGASTGGNPQHPLPDAPAGIECRGLYQLSRQCGPRVRTRSRRGGHRPVPRLRFPELDPEHESRHGSGLGDGCLVRGVHLLHRRHSRS